MDWNDSPSRAISETTAFLMNDMLADVVNACTAAQARTLGFRLPATGKAGTTNDFSDAWFIGYTPALAVGVWVGFDTPRPIMRDGFAAVVAVPLWARFMVEATRGHGPERFAPPETVVAADVCAASGRLATASCPDHRLRYFACGTEPLDYCDVHQPGLFRKIFRLPPSTATATMGGEPEAPMKKRGFLVACVPRELRAVAG
jgi:membrane carboxypeptidase/penicillin-binding protein